MAIAPHVIDLTKLSASDGFIIQGDNSFDYAGTSVASAGDVNGDGVDDLIVGAPNGDNGGYNAGEAYVIFGRAGTTRADIDLTTLTASDGFIIQGDSTRDRAGYSVASAGDVNGDGVDDLIVGAPLGDNDGTYAGEAYVIFGRAGATRADIDLTTLTASDGFIIRGDNIFDSAGTSVASAGDVNGDGVDDLLVGAPYGDNGGSVAGEAYVIFGRAGATRADIDLGALSASDGFIIEGSSFDYAGWSVASAGDINGDGFDDLIVGARSDYYSAFTSGAAYVIFGRAGARRADIDLSSLAASNGFKVHGDNTADGVGYSVASAGDVNGDGFDDLIVGAQWGDDGGSLAGEAYVIFGRTGTTRADIDLTTLAASDGFIIQGDSPYDNAGSSVASAGDVNGDGFDDLIVGAPNGDNGEAYEGEAYVIYGSATIGLGGDITGTGATDRLTGSVVGESMFGFDGNDRIRGTRGNDTLFGGKGDDVLTGGLARDTMSGGQDADTFLFWSVHASAASRAKADVITDFNATAGDLIDFHALGALDFIGTAGFTAAGQVRYAISGGTTYVEVNSVGAGAPEMTIALTGAITLGANDFLLA